MESFYTLVLLFYFYAIGGWICEIIESLIENHKFINRGFLIGPLCPIYGFGGVLIHLTLSNYAKEPVILFFMSMIICSILEYFTSYIMEKIFKNRWWDYSHMKYNINGRICLEFAFLFGIGALIMFYGINPFFFKLVDSLDETIIKIISLSLLGLTLIDVILSFNIIITLKNISNSIRCDSTEIITKKVREILSKKNYLHRRLLSSFPNMQIQNRLSVLSKKIAKDKEDLKKEKRKVKDNNKKRRKSN